MPNNGKETYFDICDHNRTFLNLCAENELDVMSFATDGAGTEIAALTELIKDTNLFKEEKIHFRFENRGVSVHFTCEVKIKNGKPFIRVLDAKHIEKNCRNSWTSGCRILLMGIGSVSYTSLMHIVNNIGENSKTIMKVNDVRSVDKQDDHAAFRLFHSSTLEDALAINKCSAVYIYVIGQVIDAVVERSLPHITRIRMIMGSYFFVKRWREFILEMSQSVGYNMVTMNRNFLASQTYNSIMQLCESSFMLIYCHAQHYPSIPLCTWLHSTEAVEHLFGLARQILPDFSLLEFQQVIPKIKRMMKIWVKESVHGFEQTSHWSNSGYSHEYFKNSSRASETCQRLPSVDEMVQATHQGLDDSLFLLRMVNMEARPRHFTSTIESLLNDTHEDDFDIDENDQNLCEAVLPVDHTILDSHDENHLSADMIHELSKHLNSNTDSSPDLALSLSSTYEHSSKYIFNSCISTFD